MPTLAVNERYVRIFTLDAPQNTRSNAFSRSFLAFIPAGQGWAVSS